MIISLLGSIEKGMDALFVMELAEEAEEDVARADIRVFRDRSNPLEEYTDRAFIRRYRISK